MAAKTRIAVAASVAMVALLAWAGMGVHQYAYDHVARYTGDVPRKLGCKTCHFDARGGTVWDRILRPRYKTPTRLAVCADGSILLATANDSDSLLVVDPGKGRVISEIPVGKRPYGVAVSRDCTTAYVANEDSDSVSVVDLRRMAVTATLPAGKAPNGVALGPGPGGGRRAPGIADLLGPGLERGRSPPGGAPSGAPGPGPAPGGGRVPFRRAPRRGL